MERIKLIQFEVLFNFVNPFLNIFKNFDLKIGTEQKVIDIVFIVVL